MSTEGRRAMLHVVQGGRAGAGRGGCGATLNIAGQHYECDTECVDSTSTATRWRGMTAGRTATGTRGRSGPATRRTGRLVWHYFWDRSQHQFQDRSF